MQIHSTEILLDSSSILNLVNSNSLEVICKLPYNFYIGPIVHGECTKQPCLGLDQSISSGKIKVLPGATISVGQFYDLSSKYGLGDGETECMAYGKALNYTVCTDDGKARESVTEELTGKSLIGSIGLLKIAVDKNIIICEEAFEIYQAMIRAGGFLPKLDKEFFCT